MPARPKKTITEKSLMPLCLRFRPQDLAVVRTAAAQASEAATVMLREIIMLRVVASEDELDLPKLTYDKTGTLSEPISVRFRPAEYRRAARAATREGVTFSLWARAVVLEYVMRAKAPSIRGSVGRDRATAVGE
jgi:hypothetical protein